MASRSPNYPACALESALGMTKKLWESEGRTAVSAEVAATAIGYKGLSGASRTMLAAMKKYGLITDDRSGSRVSDLGLQILHPASAGEMQRALREAALRPELFRSIFDSHGEASDNAIMAHLINKLGFSQTGAKVFVDAYRETLSYASLNKKGYRQDDDEEIAEEPMHSNVAESSFAPPKVLQALYSWPLADGRKVELRLTGGELTEEDIELLSDYLVTVKRAIGGRSAKKAETTPQPPAAGFQTEVR